jgi:hypothetical protein
VELDSYRYAAFSPILNGVSTYFNYNSNSDDALKLYCYGLFADNELYAGAHP